MADAPDRLEQLRVKLREFVRERAWEQFHNPKNLAMCLASEVGELLAEYRWVSTAEAVDTARQEPIRTRIARELGDVGIAWLLLCDQLGMDPMEVVERKLELNRTAYPVEKSRGRSERP
jgi:dCTP diphosphatase